MEMCQYFVLGFLSICLLASFNIPLAKALLCYTCTYNEADKDQSCLLNTKDAVAVTNCTKKYCTLMRQERVATGGHVASFLRGCEDKPQYLDKVEEDYTFITYYRSCNTDLCNGSDGRAKPSADGSSISSNAIVVGENKAGGRAKGTTFGLYLLVISAIIINVSLNLLWPFNVFKL